MHVHILPDQKFNDAFINHCEKASENNKYIGYSPSGIDYPNSHIEYFDDLKELIGEVKSSKASKIYIHMLSSWRVKVLRGVSETRSITWIPYGTDVYGMVPFTSLHMSSTRKSIIRTKGVYDYIKSKARNIVMYQRMRKLISKIDRFAFWFKGDFELVKKWYKTEMEFITFRYGDIKKPTSVNTKSVINVEKILLGNSAAPTNNHVDAIKRISDVNGDIEIICPLNYAGREKYINRVIDIGKDILGDNFCPLRKYMDKSKYLGMIQNVDAAIFYHKRQQAGGNIHFLLWAGIPVFLHETNPLLRYFKEKSYGLVSDTKNFKNRIRLKEGEPSNTVENVRSTYSEKTIMSGYKRLLNKN